MVSSSADLAVRVAEGQEAQDLAARAASASHDVVSCHAPAHPPPLRAAGIAEARTASVVSPQLPALGARRPVRRLHAHAGVDGDAAVSSDAITGLRSSSATSGSSSPSADSRWSRSASAATLAGARPRKPADEAAGLAGCDELVARRRR